MNEYIVRTSNLDELAKHATILYKTKLLDIVFIDTDKSKEEVMNIDGVYSVELNDTFGTLCS